MRRWLILLAIVLIAAVSVQGDVRAAPAEQAETAVAKPMIMAFPFAWKGPAPVHSAMTLAHAAHFAERLENDPSFDAVDTVTVPALQVGEDIAAANAAAIAAGATYFIMGRCTGQVWRWTIQAMVYEALPNGPRKRGEARANGDLTGDVKNNRGRIVNAVTAEREFTLFSKVVGDAFAAAGLPLAAETRAALAEPPTPDAFAVLKFGQAIAAVQRGGDMKAMLAAAATAVRIDPKYAAAQRFYAGLLEKAGERLRARIHYEAAIELKPDDYRSLMALGRIEIANDPGVAAGYLRRSIIANPHAADVHYWLGRALLALGDKTKAADEFAAARDRNPKHLAARRALYPLLAERDEYVRAAAEIRAILRQAPGDARLWFTLAACERAAGLLRDARKTLASASARFPNDPRYDKFRGDLEMEDGNATEAELAYRDAMRIAPKNAKLAAAIEGKILGGVRLRDAVREGAHLSTEVDDVRVAYQLTANDAAIEFSLRGMEACKDGGAVSSVLRTQALGETYMKHGSALARLAADLARTVDAGEDAALTPKEEASLRRIRAASATSERDVREMAAQRVGTILTLYRRHRCETFDGPLSPMTAETIWRRNELRLVTLPEVRPPDYRLPISPDVPPVLRESIRFRVDNRDGTTPLAVTVDGVHLGDVAQGASAEFVADEGPHALCALAPNRHCGDPGTVRDTYLHRGWTLTVRSQ